MSTSTLLPYEAPALVRHQIGLMNKFSRTQAARPLSHIDGVSVESLVAAYGSPLFVFSEKTLIERFRELRDSFAVRFPRVRIAWSWKTNYLDGICSVFRREGAWGEVVSEFEWEKAVKLGVPPEQIHFNGPMKTEAVLERVLPLGTIVHLDNFDELAAAERVARRLDIRPKVAIRINLTTDHTPAWDRFGFSLESGQAKDAALRLLGGGVLQLGGLHCHLGTFILEPDAYRQAATKLAGFANELRAEHGVLVEFLDMGGGFASPNTLKAQYLPGEQVCPSFSRYASAIADGLRGLDYPLRDMPTLVLETGRALVDEAGYLVSTVVANKRLPDGTRALVLDGGVNLLFTAYWYKHDVLPCSEHAGIPEPTVMYEPLCMNIDVVREASLFPPMKVGERVVFRNVGAYNVTQWMQFIMYRPAVVMVGQNGEHALLRRREDLESIRSHEETPAWLQPA